MNIEAFARAQRLAREWCMRNKAPKPVEHNAVRVITKAILDNPPDWQVPVDGICREQFEKFVNSELDRVPRRYEMGARR